MTADQSAGVSVVIPTVRRPVLVLRAVRSVLAQTRPPLEAIVVIDGPDAETEAALAGILDPRLRVMRNPVPVGAGPARNIGAAAARGEWLAFLDDDDEWLPDKLGVQLAGRSPAEAVVLSCRCRVHAGRATHVWPRRLPRAGQAVSDYLYGRRSPLRGEAYLATPTLVMPHHVFERAGGFGASEQNEDTTLLLQATAPGAATLVMRPEVLVAVHVQPAAASLGSVFSWRESLAWLDGVADRFGPRAYSGFCLVNLGAQAARQGDRAAIGELLRRVRERGALVPLHLALFASYWLTPIGARAWLRRLAGGARAEGSTPC